MNENSVRIMQSTQYDKITVDSMFAGIGGIDLGFVDAGFTIK